MIVTSSPCSRDAELVRLAATQEQVVATRQLRALGMTSKVIARRVDHGLLHRAMAGVYTVGVRPSELSREGWAFAATLRHRGLSAAAAATAAVRLGIWDREPRDAPLRIVSATTGGRMHPLGVDRIEIVTTRSTTLLPPDVATVEHLPTTTALRTLRDASAEHEPLQLTRMICQACYLDLIEIHVLRDELDAALHVPGTSNLRDALTWYLRGSAGTRSRSEDELVRLIRRWHLPMPLVNVRGSTGLRGMECDFVWPTHRLVVELDGGGHDLQGMRDQDAERDAALRAEGWRVIRFHYMDVWHHPGRVMRAITDALAR